MTSKTVPDARIWTSLVAALALMIGACGGGSDGSQSANDDGPASFEEMEFESPIADFLGQTTDYQSDDAQAAYIEQAAETEEKIAACMAAEGFEYTPVDQSQAITYRSDSGELAYFSDEWVAKYGFGITTQRFAQSAVGPDLAGYDDQAMGQESVFVDPNQEYQESLSDAERTAYQEALWGDMMEPAEEDTATEQSASAVETGKGTYMPSGCQNEAWAEASVGAMAFYEEFGDELEGLYEQLEADSRVRAFRDEVAACVAEQGLEYTTMEDLYSRWDSQLSQLDSMSGDPFEGTELDPAEMTEEELNDFFQQAEKLDPDQLATLADVQAEELALAEAVVGCGGGPLNEQVKLSEVRIELEQEFLDTNADRVAEFENSASGS